MKIILISCFIYLFKTINCYTDSESAESNRVEVTPFYDTFIYSDIADIINDIENNGISPIEDFTDNESQSNESVEDLLTEYQNYLEKAHNKRKHYVDKLKLKNKVPLLRHDQYSKLKPGAEYKRNEFYYNSFYNPANYKLQQMSFNNPLHAFNLINFKDKYTNKGEVTTDILKGSRGDILPFEKILINPKTIIDLSPVNRHKPPTEPVKSQCYCKNGYIPCECNSKQYIPQTQAFWTDQKIQMHSTEEQKKISVQWPSIYSNSMAKYEHNTNRNVKNQLDGENMLTIHIKLDLQLPKIQDKHGKIKFYDRTFEPEDAISKEFTTAIKLPFPYFNYPTVPFSYKRPYKFNKEENVPSPKITIHKKKKSKTNNTNKRHRKKIITFHNIKVEHQPLYPIRLFNNITNTYNNSSIGTKRNMTTYTTELPSSIVEHNNATMINKTVLDITNDTQTEERINVIVNITNNAYNNMRMPVTTELPTEDNNKVENSIESDITKTLNATTKSIKMRNKREIFNLSKDAVRKYDDKQSKLIKSTDITKQKHVDKKFDKNILSESELTYWPSIPINKTYVVQKNITTIILESEHEKTKLNISNDSIRQNHKKALEQAIFGDVNWNDIDKVAPAFMSFVGKYIHGILTFCSQLVCHSINCADKICLHRICRPSDRFNNKGHCTGSNNTDSVASMESIMDLPSNVAFEIVDILQNNMSGKIYGKATFCINSKCITLVASKKNFNKTRCTTKELNVTGHCPNTKTLKVM